ncbi:MAG: glycosyltransferase, partial [bacterium]
MTVKLSYLLNIFGAGAVPNILMDLIPHLEGYQISILSLQEIDRENDYMVEKCLARGIQLESLGLKRKEILRSYRALKKYLQEKQPDIIHSHLGRADILSAFVRPEDSILITTFHNVRENYQKLIRAMYYLTDNMVDYRVSVSHAVQNSWYGKWHLKSRNRVIYNPVSFERVESPGDLSSIKSEFGIKTGDKLLLSIGRLIKQKGHIYLIESMEKIVQEDKSVKLIIAGTGHLKGSLEKEIIKRGLEDYIYLAGFRSDIPELLELADLFVFPSLWEGLGLAVLEAMIARVPVVA